MAEAEQQDGTDRRSLVAAFVNEVRGEAGGPSKMVPRAWAVGLTVLVVGAGAVGVGMLAGGGSHHGASTKAAGAAATPAVPAAPPTGQKSPDQPSPAGPGSAAPAPASDAPGGGPLGASTVGGSGGGPNQGRQTSGSGGSGTSGGSVGSGGGNPPAAPAGGAPAAPQPGAAAPAPGGSVPVTNNTVLKSGVYTAVAGYGCAAGSTQGFSEAGRNANGPTGWYSVSHAGWSQDGCNGQFDAMPMSGDSNKDDPGNYALWTFTPGALGMRTATCQVQLYVPNDSDVTHVGGDPAHFESYTSISLSSPMLNSFDVDQKGHLGEWKQVGSFNITSGVLMIKLDSRGQDWHGTTATNAHLAVAQMRATCS